MNKVFKVIWSEARNAYVVVSEMAKSHGTKSCSTKKLLAMLIATGVMTCASVAPVMAKSLTDTKTEPKMIGYGQQWDTEKGILGTSIQAYQSQGNSLQLNMLRFEKYTTPKGENALAIRLGANIDGGNKSGNIYLVDKNTKNQTLTTTINGSVIKTVLTDTDDKKVESSVDIGGYVDKTVKKAKTEVKAGENVTSVVKETGANGQDIYTINAKDTTYVAGNGIVINGENNAISVKLKEGESNLQVTDAGLELKKDLTVNSVNAGDYFFDAERGVGFGGEAYVTQSGLNANNKVITNVAAGEADTDAVNVAQLNAVKAAAGKKVSLVDGENTKATLVKDDATGTQYKVDVDLSKYAKTEDVAVVYDKNKTSLRSTNAIVAENAIALGKDASAVKDGGVALGNEAHAGNKGTSLGTKAKSGREGATVVGYNTNSSGLYSTVVGTDAVINTDGTAYQTPVKDVIVQGAAATVVGSKNTVDNKNKKVYSGVANNIMGAANTIKASNGITIQGSGNTVTDAYKDMDIDFKEGLAILGGDYSVLAKKQSGAVAVIGGANTVSKQTDSTVIGYDNKLTGDNEKGSHDVFMAGSHNELTNVSDSIVMGNKNVITGVSNVISFGHQNEITANNAVAIGSGAGVSAEGGVALGVGSVASTAAGALGYGADGKTDATWQATKGAVSVGGNGVTRQITNVAAGTEDTDAVNVSQLNAVATEAGKHTTLSNGKNTTVESTVKDGQTDYKVNVAGDLTDITSVANGDSKINLNKDSIIISNGNKYFAITNSGIGMSYIGADYSAKSIMLGENGTTISGGLNVAGSKITGVAEGVADTDAVNVGQLNAAVQAGNTDTHIKPGEYGVGADNKVNMDVVDKNGNKVDTVTIKDVAKASDVGNVNNIASDIKNQDGSHTTVVDAVNNLNNKLDNKVGDLNYVEGGKGNYVTNGENTTTSIGKLDQALKDVADTANQGWNLSTNGGEASKVAPGKTVDFSGDKNIIISNDGTNVKVKLNEAIDVNTVTANTVTTRNGNTVMNSDGVKVGADVSLNQNGLNVGKDVSVTATAVTAGKTSISDEGVKVGDKTYINDKGLNANGQNITNVADGKVEKDSKDAINGGQLHQAKADINNRIDGVENQVVNNTNRINKLGSRVNKVGAGAAALAALHPMDFDPDDKLTFSAGYGNYGGENAAAIGAYYRPDEKVMFSVAGTVGNGENMVNAGVSFALDRTNHVSNSRTALAREVIDLRGQLAVMGAKMAKMEKAFGMLDETKTKLFPDVPANHWAYEYIAKLAGNGYIEGYPDGNFGGDRLMTRYEFAAMLYRAIEKGAALEEKIIKEFEPELGRIRVDRISGEDGDRDKIERVRVNDTKGERDHYGNKLAK